MYTIYTNKPKTYQCQATIETINNGQPYYVSSPTYGYEGEHIPIAGSISNAFHINEHTGEVLNDYSMKSKSLWVTCTKSRYQHSKYRRCSLLDDGVIYQTYSDRLAFTNMLSALRYAKTGKV